MTVTKNNFKLRTDFQFNLADQVTQVTLPATGQTGPGRAYSTVTYLYVGGPSVTTTAFDEGGNTVRHETDTLGNEGEELAQSGSGETAQFQYDAAARLKTLTDGDQHSIQQAYSNLGDLNKLTYPGGATEQASYDIDSNLVQSVNARSQSVSMTLAPDDSRILSALHSADGTQDQYSYDGLGRVSQVSNASSTLNYAYNSLDMIVSEITNYPNLPAGMLPPEIDYQYYPDGALAIMSTPAGSFSYQYTKDNRLAQESTPWGDVYCYTYDASGALINKHIAYASASYTHNAVGQLTELKNQTIFLGQTTTLTDFTNLQYDGAGNLLQETVNYFNGDTVPYQSSMNAGTRSFTYDSEDRVTGEQDQFNMPTWWLTPEVQALGFTGNFNFSSASDGADNLTSLRGVAQSSNALNQVVSDGNGSSYSYDLDGNTTNYNIYNGPIIGGVANHALTYSDAGCLSGFDTSSMGYRPDGLRGWKLAAGSETFYLYSGGRLIYAFDGHGSYKSFGWGATGIEQEYTFEALGYGNGASVQTFLHDVQGNVISHQYTAQPQDFQQYDAFGQGLFYYDYTGSGPILTMNGLLPAPFFTGDGDFGFAGQSGALTDWDLGDLLLMTHRYYSPTSGRFITRDPIGYEGGINEYAYTRNNPVNGVDPSGLDIVQNQEVKEIAEQSIKRVGENSAKRVVAKVVPQQVEKVVVQSAVKKSAGAGAAALLEGVAEIIPGINVAMNVGFIVDAAGEAYVAYKDAVFQEGTAPSEIALEGFSNEEALAATNARGGTYVLVDNKTGKVVRTGRTNDLKRREREHRNDPVLRKYKFVIDKRTNSYAAQRGREQIIHELYKGAIHDKINGIDQSRNRKLYEYYMEEGRKLP